MTSPNHKWYQFSLRSLLLVATVIGMACSWIAYERTMSAKQRAAVEALENHSAGNTSISYEVDTSPRPNALKFLLGDDSFGKMTQASLNDKSISDADLVHLKVLPSITDLFLGPNITDKGLVHIQNLGNLKTLCLANTRITDEGLRSVRKLSQLKELYLDDTHVSDVGLHYICEINVTHLSLSDTLISDAGLVYLADMTALEYLNVAGTQVTDVGLSRLGAIKTLTEVNITLTPVVTDLGIQSLQAALPSLVIVDRFGRLDSE